MAVDRILAAVMIVPLAACSSFSHKAPTLSVAGEQLQGERLANGVQVFRGVPFAAPPVADLRWRAPQPVKPRLGVSDATKFAPACPQDQGNPNWYRDVATALGSDPKAIQPLTDVSEDCLYLNIWTPKASPAAGLPVMIWIHGGSNVNGWAYEPNYLGHNLARKGLVVVSINYRLGPLGFMAHPLLSKEDFNGVSGYYGLLDQLAAIKWVKARIASFGGNPDQITLAGESAGGGDIAALIDMDSASGLFQRAIIQSGALGPNDRSTLSASEAVGARLINHLGAKSLDQMRQLPWQDLVRARREVGQGHYFAPIADNVYLKELATRAEKVPLLIGSNHDEWRMYLPDDLEKAYRDGLRTYGGSSATSVDNYLTQRYADLATRTDRLISAAEFLCPSLQLAANAAAAGNASYLYHFTRVRPGPNRILAYHGAEIPYMFDTADVWLPADRNDRQLTDWMVNYWANFVRAGNPNGPKLPFWAKLGPFSPAGLTLDVPARPIDTEALQICEKLKTNDVQP